MFALHLSVFLCNEILSQLRFVFTQICQNTWNYSFLIVHTMNTYFVKVCRVHVLRSICASDLFFGIITACLRMLSLFEFHSCVRSINCRKKIFEVDLKTFGWDKKDVYSSCDGCYNCAAVGCHTLHLDTRPRLVDCALIMLSLLQSKNEGGISFYSFLDERLPGPATLHKLNQVQHI